MEKRSVKDLRIQSILTIARAVFEEFGYEKAKVSEIAGRIGIVEGTIFHHFGNKRALLIKVMEAFYTKAISEQEEGLKGIDDVKARLSFLIRFHLQVFNENAALCRVILSESRKEVQGNIKEDIRQFNRAYTGFIRQVVDQGVTEGVFRPDLSGNLIRNTILGAIEHTLWSHLLEEQQIDVDLLVDQMTKLVFGGIEAKDVRKEEVGVLIKKLNSLI